MQIETNKEAGLKKQDRILGDEWLDWEDSGEEEEIIEGKRTFLILSLVVMISFILLTYLFWYLVRPRFELYGRPYFLILTGVVTALVVFFLVWYILFMIAVLSRKNYLNVCLQKSTNLLIVIFPLVLKLAQSLGISRDRLGHSFIRVSNRLAINTAGEGPVLALLPRCLRKELKQEVKAICSEFSEVIHFTAPGGNVARKVVSETKPKAIVAVACERDLVSGIQDIAPKIPVIGIPNRRPKGPCKDTSIDLNEFRSALNFFCRKL